MGRLGEYAQGTQLSTLVCLSPLDSGLKPLPLLFFSHPITSLCNFNADLAPGITRVSSPFSLLCP